MKKIVGSLCLCSILFAANEYEANLAGHIVIPAENFINAPKDAPEFLQSTGKFLRTIRNENLGAFNANYTEEESSNTFRIPFKKQALQGHSGVKFTGDKSYWLLSDNGLGTKKNSPDSMTFIHNYEFDFQKGSYKHLKTIFFNDKDKKFPYLITLESTKSRYLTGADIDPESFQIVGKSFWVGDEFGPFLLEFDEKGTLKELFDVSLNRKPILSPDNPSLQLSNPDILENKANIKRSKGFEAMASSKDKTKLYPMLEYAIFKDGRYENKGGKNYLRILEFDIKARKFTDKSYAYILESNAHSIGDFNMIDEEYGLIIERDDTEGTMDKACRGQEAKSCFKNPAKFKRIYKVKLDDKKGVAEKIAYIDLMNINDTNKIAKKPLVNGKFVFPFFTIEDVDIVDDKHIVVANDNNFPFSSSREPYVPDDNEIILLEVEEFLKIK
ncbi:esterase-like activity of phytase family protein [Campylobacter vulpis]|uniref:esterase-like activity of phytase family protein n=1 Tax=Campylobacter vulpis TaxID=1655500 RepID=UPI001BD0EE88|nr:esterase-like activity of phytase family protein [Campylobacter vulpis]MBS4234805.1 esterase-like activity of phytase family protein [Campylobacter vulpis]MBS4268425.1 esterase-like activity of phytase family protein [Campylobacter vulpis]